MPDIGGQRHARPRDAAIAVLATRQHGVVARRQLVALGLSLGAIDHRVEEGRLLALHRGVYAVGHRRLTRHGVWMAAVLAAGKGVVLRRRSAAALWGIRGGEGSRDVEVHAPGQVRHRAGLRVRRGPLPEDEVTVHEGIPVTTPARTLLDLAAVLDPHRLARAAERAEALRLGSPTSLRELVDRYPRRPGTPAIRTLVERGAVVGTDTRSEAERGFLSLLDAADLPTPRVNAPLELPDGRTVTPDFTWRAQRLVVETDGFETHGTREAVEGDRARDRALQAAGWRVIRVTWRQLREEPVAIAAAVRDALGAATPPLPPAPGSRGPGGGRRPGPPSRR